MSFRAYKNYKSGNTEYVFEGEEHRLPAPLDEEDFTMWIQGFWDLFYEKLPPNPSTILATATFMTDMPYLDSLKTIYELDRKLNIEAEQDREDRAYQEMIKHI